MTPAEKYLLDNNCHNLVIGKDGDKFIYVSDLIEQYDIGQHDNITTNKYRLLEDGEFLQEGDEYLLADCETWEKINASIGFEYMKSEFIVVRRRTNKGA